MSDQEAEINAPKISGQVTEFKLKWDRRTMTAEVFVRLKSNSSVEYTIREEHLTMTTAMLSLFKQGVPVFYSNYHFEVK